ncbi:MAG: ABC transporter permease subunit [Deinococcaceae bacterium]
MIWHIAWAELRKAKAKKRFWFLFVLMGVIVPLLQVVISYFVTQSVAGTLADPSRDVSNAIAEQASTGFSLGRNFLGVGALFFLLPISAIVGNFLIGEERGFKMWKVIFVAQPSRMSVLAGKFLGGMVLLTLLILCSGAANMAIGFVANLIFFRISESGDWLTLLSLYGLQCVVLAAPLALSMLISSIIAAPAMSLIGTVLLPPILEGIVTASIATQLNRLNAVNAAFQALKIKNLFEEIPRYYLTRNLNLGTGFAGSSASGGLFGNPNAGLKDNPLGNLLQFSWSETTWSVCVSVVYAALFLVLFFILWRRRDVLD